MKMELIQPFINAADAVLAQGLQTPMAAALSEAAADTTSSEVGQAFGKTARLVTTWSPVTPGTDGAVSLAGTMSLCIPA